MNLHRYTAVFPFLFSIINAQSYSTLESLTTAHGSLASLAFLVLFPTAAIIIRLGTFRHAVAVHAVLQVISYSIFVAAAGMGIYVGKYGYLLHEKHPIIGMVLLAVLFFQAPTGFLHHYLFKKYSKRTIPSYWHIFIGRAAVILGMINGGLGLQLGDVAHKWRVAYAVVAGVIGTAYLVSAVYGEFRRSRPTANSSDVERKAANSAE